MEGQFLGYFSPAPLCLPQNSRQHSGLSTVLSPFFSGLFPCGRQTLLVVQAASLLSVRGGLVRAGMWAWLFTSDGPKITVGLLSSVAPLSSKLAPIFFSFFREGKGERNISVWLPLTRPLLGTWPTTEACALTGNLIFNPLVHSPVLNPLSCTSQEPFFEVFFLLGILQHYMFHLFWCCKLENRKLHVTSIFFLRERKWIKSVVLNVGSRSVKGNSANGFL